MKNEYRINSGKDYCEIFFSDGSSFLIDIEDFDKVSKYTWFFGKRGYPIMHTSRKSADVHKTVPLHKYLLEVPTDCDVDHISGDKLDNRRGNLRVCTHQENMFNQKLRCNNSTGFYGVSYHKSANKFEAYIHVSGKKYYLGLYENIKDAADVRDAAAIQYFGEYANLNRDLEVYAS